MISTLLVLNGKIKNDFKHWEEAFIENKSFEHKILYIVKKETFINKVFSKIGIPINLLGNINLLLNLIKKDFDLIILIKPISIFPFILKFKKKARVFCVPIDNMTKKHNSSYYFKYILKYCDAIFINNGYRNTSKFYLRNSKTILKFWDRSYSLFHHKPKKKEINYKFTVLFIGTYEQIRLNIFEFLSENGVKVDVFGNGWKHNYVKSKNLTIHKKPLLKKDYINAIQKAKINLSFLRKIQDDTQTMRTFEIPACGGFMITERTNCHDRIFKEDYESVYFENKFELLERIKFYLNDEEKRKKIIRNALKKLTYNDTYSGKLKIIENLYYDLSKK